MTGADLARIAETRAMVGSGRARAVRLACGVSLAEVAQAAAVTAPTVWKWEHGETLPRGQAALRYRDVLDALTAPARIA